MRAGAYSPNHIGNDAAIFMGVCDHLRKRGCEVRILTETEFQEQEIHEDYILDMCREQASIRKLEELEDAGKLVVNSGFGIENCTRERMTRLLLGNGFPHPVSLMVDTNENVQDALKEAGIERCWIKRGDFHAMHKEDVSYCRHREEAQEVLHEFYFRGIRRAVINEHLDGDLVKFYGVEGTDFFYWFYPFDSGHGKYGLEAINGKSKGLHFDLDILKDNCNRAAKLLDVKVYGGDCIVGADGVARIIDFNDWPSFAPCRQDAAPYIAKCVLSAIKAWRKKDADKN